MDIVASSTSLLTRTLELQDHRGRWLLQASHAFTSTMELTNDDGVVARIERDHAFTRRGRIHAETLSPLVAFAFWLTAMTWKRSRDSNNAAGGAAG